MNKIAWIPKLSDENKAIIFIFVLLIGIGFICQKSRNADLQQNGKLIFVTVDKISLDQYGNPDFHLCYTYDKEQYCTTRSFVGLSYRRCKKELLGKKIGLVISKKNPRTIEILIDDLSFSNAGLEMPDSSKRLYEKIKSSW